MSTQQSLVQQRVLADHIPNVTMRNAMLITAGVALTALAAQIAVPLPFTPVPVSGQTFAVLVLAAVLGPGRAVATQAAYWAIGLVGVPVFADASGGVQIAFGATGGYLLGFMLASVVVGTLARRGLGRKPLTMLAAWFAGSVTIFAVALPWLAVVTGSGLQETLAAGFFPFVIGDIIKAALAALVVPGLWKLVRGHEASA